MLGTAALCMAVTATQDGGTSSGRRKILLLPACYHAPIFGWRRALQDGRRIGINETAAVWLRSVLTVSNRFQRLALRMLLRRW